MKKIVLSFVFFFCVLMAFTQHHFTISDFQSTRDGENTTYVLKPEQDIKEFSLELDAEVVSEKGNFSLAWNFCDAGDCNLFYCYSNAFFDLTGNSPMVLLMTTEVKINLSVKVVDDHAIYYQLFLNNELKSEGYRVIERDFSRKLYLNLTVTGEAFKINPPSREYVLN